MWPNAAGRGRPRSVKRYVHPLIEQLRAIRIKRGISQTALAVLLGYDKTSITNWERGVHSPPLNHLSDWCAALGHELIIRGNAQTLLAEVIPYPERNRLMAGK